MSIDNFKASLAGGAARPNLFRVRGSFPNGGSGALGAVAGAVGGALGGNVGNLASAIGNVLGGGGPSRKLEFLCKGAQIPASTIGVIEVPFRGRTLRLPGDRTFMEWSLTIINDTDFAIRNAFEQWMDLMNSHTQNIGPAGLQAVQQNWEVDQLDKTGSVLKTYRFVGCFPTELSMIDLSFDSTDTIEEYTVSLQYQYWTTDTTT